MIDATYDNDNNMRSPNMRSPNNKKKTNAALSRFMSGSDHLSLTPTHEQAAEEERRAKYGDEDRDDVDDDLDEGDQRYRSNNKNLPFFGKIKIFINKIVFYLVILLLWAGIFLFLQRYASGYINADSDNGGIIGTVFSTFSKVFDNLKFL